MQIVGYARTPDAALVVAEAGQITRIDLTSGEQIAYSLQERHCAGTIGDGGHRPCDREDVPWCPEHTETWVCARCRGTCLKDVMDCHDPHVVYLAIVAPDAVKVGVTKAHRIETRLHEQGADRGVVIHDVANGRIAREIETEIARDLPDRIPTAAKIAGLTQSIDEAVWASTVSGYEPIATYEPSYDLDIDDQPIQETLASGRIRGTKGRVVVFEAGGSMYVTDLRDLVGHRIVSGVEERNLQTGLGVFG